MVGEFLVVDKMTSSCIGGWVGNYTNGMTCQNDLQNDIRTLTVGIMTLNKILTVDKMTWDKMTWDKMTRQNDETKWRDKMTSDKMTSDKMTCDKMNSQDNFR